MNTSIKGVCLIGTVVLLAGCSKEKTRDWYLQSGKDERIVVYHEGKRFVARCRGVKFAHQDTIFPGNCSYLMLHVGQILPNGQGTDHISRPGRDIIYWRDNQGLNGTYETYTVLDESPAK